MRVLACIIAGIVIALFASSLVYMLVHIWQFEVELAERRGRGVNFVSIFSTYFLLGPMPILGLLGCSLAIRWYWKEGLAAFRTWLRGGYLIWSLGVAVPLGFVWMKGFEALGMYSGDEPSLAITFTSLGASVFFVYVGTALMLGRIMRWYYAVGAGILTTALECVPLLYYWLFIFNVAFGTSITV